MASRRDFLTGSAAVGLGIGLGAYPALGAEPGGERGMGIDAQVPLQEVPRSPNPLRILILGGTAFLGPGEVDYALARGHTITLFNRGRTNPGMYPNVEKLVGDRATPDYSALEGREWDVVIDNSANVATWVMDSARILENSVGRYLFVSSISAHSDNSVVGMRENGPVFSEESYETAAAAGGNVPFGDNKAQAERVTLRTFGDRGLVVRPGLIVGPGDRSGRFTYWPVRIDKGGEILAPGDGSDGAQIVDVRDLGAFLVHLVEQEASGTFNATGPDSPMTMAGMLYGVQAVTSTPGTITWVDADFLTEHEVRGWSELPVWFPPSPEMRGFSSYDCSKAFAAGLKFRPLAETALDTLEWWKALPPDQQTSRSGLDPEKEANVLRAWHAMNG